MRQAASIDDAGGETGIGDKAVQAIRAEPEAETAMVGHGDAVGAGAMTVRGQRQSRSRGDVEHRQHVVLADQRQVGQQHQQGAYR